MNGVQRILAIVCFGLIGLNATFPPRVYEHDLDKSAGRRSILSADFNRAEVTQEEHEILGVVTLARTRDRAVLDRDRLFAYSIAGSAFGVVLIAIAGSSGRRRHTPQGAAQ